MGDSSWSNFRLLCGACNIRRSNYVEGDIRKALATDDFRNIVATYLSKKRQIGDLPDSPFLDELIKRFMANT
jgi:5-methylcytosine-specific restriction endonuclease McrA